MPKRVLGRWRPHPFARITKPNIDKQYNFFADIVPTISFIGKFSLPENLQFGKLYFGVVYKTLCFWQAAGQRHCVFDEGVGYTIAVDVTGLFPAKLDGTARGGIVIAIKDQLDIPVKFVGLGEKPEYIAEFDPDVFVESLFG